MKKIFFSFLAIAALASCAKTEAVFTQDNSEIKIAPVTAMNTKAQAGVIDGIEYPASEKFNVYAYWANQPAGSLFEADETTAGAYLSNVTFVNKGKYWGGATTQYWPKNGSLRFAAYSPADKINNMTHNLAADTYELNGFTYPTTVGEMYDILVAPTSKSYTAQTAAENVSVVFEHALSWITFKVKSQAPVADAFTVKEIILNNVNNHGNMVADMKAGTKTWSTAMPQAVTVFDQAAGRLVPTNPTEAPIFENAGNNGTQLLVLPQATTSVTINFTQNEVGSAPALPNQTVTIPLTLDGGQPWEAGKHYTYTVVFDLDEILINPSVEDWEDVIEVEVDATATEVANAQELVEAVAAGRSVRLTENINLDKPVVVDPTAYTATRSAEPTVEVTVDLNGKTITSVGDVFEVKGGTLNIVGDGLVKAATNNGEKWCAVWAYGSSVVNIYGGVYEIGYDEGDYNDLIYAKENATINIYGGEFKNSGRSNAFVLNIFDDHRETAFINVYGGKYHDFDPANSKSENDGYSFVAEGYGSYELTENVWTVASKTAEIEVTTEAALVDAAAQGANVVLAADIQLEKPLSVSSNVVVDLNGKTLSIDRKDHNQNYVFLVLENGHLTINGNGNVAPAANKYSIAVWAYGGDVVINGGNYTNAGEGSDLILADKGSVVTINGGVFQACEKQEGVDGTNQPYSALNCKDNSGSTFIVYGGTYFGFDPANNTSEGVGTNFVADGYKSVQNGDWYTVMAE